MELSEQEKAMQEGALAFARKNKKAHRSALDR